jgi:anti-anti-sigma factor
MEEILAGRAWKRHTRSRRETRDIAQEQRKRVASCAVGMVLRTDMSVLDVTTEIDGTTAFLAMDGELDIAGAPRVERELERLEAEEPETLVLDLRRLAFMDSTGLRLVVAADARAREQGRRLVVVRGPEAVQRIFHMTRLDERREIVDEPDALHAS